MIKQYACLILYLMGVLLTSQGCGASNQAGFNDLNQTLEVAVVASESDSDFSDTDLISHELVIESVQWITVAVDSKTLSEYSTLTYTGEPRAPPGKTSYS